MPRLLDEVVLQKYALKAHGLNYLTNIEAEADLINTLDPQFAKQNEKLVANMTHTLPLINNASIEKILKIREHEPKSFELYQASMKTLMSQVASETDGKKIKEAVDDTITPQIKKINRVIEANRIIQLKKVAGGSAITGVSIAAGLFGNKLFGMDLSQFLTAIGLAGGSIVQAPEIAKIFEVPQDAMTNDFYFLWKLSNTR